eukprot:UN24071
MMIRLLKRKSPKKSRILKRCLVIIKRSLKIVQAKVNEKKETHDFILCASLVEKIPNLGGLFRTSEVFSAHSVVIHNKKILNDKTFKTFTKTAHEHLDVLEVQRIDLFDWLKKQKDNGYTIIGLEQTKFSQSI